MSTSKELRSDIAWSTADRVVVKGFDLAKDLLGQINLGDMAFIEIFDRLPTSDESVMLNALLVSFVEHGLTPSALVTRLTYLGAPESFQAAIAAGILGLGTVFVGTVEGSARMLQEALEGVPSEEPLDTIAKEIVARHRQANQKIPGIGHPIHKPIDPRAERLLEIATDCGFSGRYVQLMWLVSRVASEHYSKTLPVNVTGAIGAIASEMAIPWNVCRGLGVIARSVGLIGHIREEMGQPIAREIWFRTEAEATRHLRPDL
ncbi:citryl-CoA lyase [Kyrpidia spormannii]|uniref:citrate synthase (unknown stereospecificity) n=1 Tax=Kyrpidia spormannii TaxID=2055160 RepID=A0A2K8N5B9_9BACL|nr:citryl-CoA lyase [Kyrpidia spormannii]ATY84549.1 citryl-CoA lyase [Kyrpidia spormannii]